MTKSNQTLAPLIFNQAEILQQAPSNNALDTANNQQTLSSTATRRRTFKGQSLEQRQQERRNKLIQAGLQVYGTKGFFNVTVRDVCQEVQLTERYFYESFKRTEDLFKTVYLTLVEQLQITISDAVMQGKADPKLMIQAGLSTLFKALQHDPRMARILYIDAPLVHEMHGSTLHDSLARFDRMIQATLLLALAKQTQQHLDLSLMATGLTGFVTHTAIHWVSSGFKEDVSVILKHCYIAFIAVLDWLEHAEQSDYS